jgi:phenylacetate-coenzyme A ligase PaaK-like adenylate-forming protein
LTLARGANDKEFAMSVETENLREQRLRRTLRAVGLAHPFYRARFREWGVVPGDIRTLDDLERLPPTRKDDYIADPEAFRLQASDLPEDFAPSERVLWDIAYTTGTTSGRPSPFYNTTHDAYAIWDQARRCNEAEGVLATDRIANLYPLADFPTGAFLCVIRSGMIAGLPVVQGMTGSAQSEFKVRHSLAEALDNVSRFRPTVLWGVPSFVRRFLEEAVRRGDDFTDVRLVITSGEPMPPALRAELRERLARLGAGDVAIRARYAFTEMQGGLVQCAEEAPGQNVTPDLYHLEVLDPDSGRRLPEDEPGMLAITHLHRRGTVLLRYLVGDIVTLSRVPCPHCGRIGERVVSTPRRTGNLVKCRGMLVNTDVVIDVLSAVEGLGQFQVVFARDDAPGAMERMVIRIEREADEAGAAALRERLTQGVQRAVSLRPEVEFVARGALYDQERSIKARRVVDLRPKVD